MRKCSGVNRTCGRKFESSWSGLVWSGPGSGNGNGSRILGCFLLAVLGGHWVKLRASPAKSPGALNLFQQTWRLANLVRRTEEAQPSFERPELFPGSAWAGEGSGQPRVREEVR